MAHVEQRGGKRKSNVDLNIVPFIDLMSVLITFLLIAAVWTQVSMIQIGSSIYGQKTQDETTPPKHADIPFRLDVKAAGYQVLIAGRKEMIPKRDNEYDEASLTDYLKKIKETSNTIPFVLGGDWYDYLFEALVIQSGGSIMDPKSK